ncbi:DUF4363 family protein [Candidatus Allofournierella excrementavium]|uniref:DUF4363 family protein n=1 Tax=Candidatus Allofournierella excrementavium TaxID=2838591 RepID=UPI003A855A67
MKRVRAAFGLLAFLAVLIVASSILVETTNDTLLHDLDQIGTLSAAGNYEAALEVIDGMNGFFSRREHWMALFIKRDYLSGIAMCLGGLSAYVGPDNQQDLQSELGKARTQILMTGHLFFSML